MVSGLFSAKTVVHLSTTPATASFEHAVAVCTETPALNTSTTALIARRVCIISSLIPSATSPISARFLFFRLPPSRNAMRADVIRPCACCARPAIGHHDHRAAEQQDKGAPFQTIELHWVPSQGRIAGYRIGEEQSAGYT